MNYYDEVKEDVLLYCEENWDDVKDKSIDEIYDDCFISDSVTGNASGSYYCNTWKAQEMVLNNQSIVEEAVKEFGVDMSQHYFDWEYLDVTARCFCLNNSFIEEALNEISKEKENKDKWFRFVNLEMNELEEEEEEYE